MACSPDTIVCELAQLERSVEQLRQPIGGWDWGSFASALLATLIGAAIGVVGVLVVASRERGERYEGRLDEAVAKLMQVLADYADAIDDRVTYWTHGHFRLQPPAPMPPAPARTQLAAAKHTVAMLARDADAVTYNLIEHVIDVSVDRADKDFDAFGANVLRALGLLSDWRSQSFPRDVVEQDAERALAEIVSADAPAKGWPIV